MSKIKMKIAIASSVLLQETVKHVAHEMFQNQRSYRPTYFELKKYKRVNKINKNNYQNFMY